MNKDFLDKQINYWLSSAEHDYETMLSLFNNKRYSDALFYGHLILEKALKAVIVAEAETMAPLIHDLTTLVELAKIEIEGEEQSLLATANRFNIKSRYPDYKLNFYETCDYSYIIAYLDRIIFFYKKICRHPKLS